MTMLVVMETIDQQSWTKWCAGWKPCNLYHLQITIAATQKTLAPIGNILKLDDPSISQNIRRKAFLALVTTFFNTDRIQNKKMQSCTFHNFCVKSGPKEGPSHLHLDGQDSQTGANYRVTSLVSWSPTFHIAFGTTRYYQYAPKIMLEYTVILDTSFQVPIIALSGKDKKVHAERSKVLLVDSISLEILHMNLACE